ncbi:MAG TPA: signal peptidase II, partial [Ignavibacteriales bacterium]|nr:signal peptidase II [Ignavibacteriales bacterium]
MRVLFVTAAVVIVDQLTKLFVKGFSIPALGLNFEGMDYAQKINVLGSFFRITFVENPGMAFGIDVGVSSKLFLSLFSIAASIGIIIYLYKSKNESFIMRAALALILGGAIGNLIDRMFYGVFYGYASLFYGSVVDFLDMDIFDINLFGITYDRFPIFNVADMAVTFGVVLLIFFNKKSEEETVPNPAFSPSAAEGIDAADFPQNGRAA